MTAPHPQQHAGVDAPLAAPVEAEPVDRPWWQGALLFGVPVLAAAAGGAVAGPARPSTRRWFRSLDKPAFQPPDQVFGPVWSALYPTIALSGIRVWRAPASSERTTALALWAAQLAANAAWTPTFFGLRRPKLALGVLAAQLASTAAYVDTARDVDRPAAVLVLPYLAWTTFAGVLNAEIVRRNR